MIRVLIGYLFSSVYSGVVIGLELQLTKVRYEEYLFICNHSNMKQPKATVRYVKSPILILTCLLKNKLIQADAEFRFVQMNA